MIGFNSGATIIDFGRVELILASLVSKKVELTLSPELILLEAINRNF
jgi:hypothetical protein